MELQRQEYVYTEVTEDYTDVEEKIEQQNQEELNTEVREDCTYIQEKMDQQNFKDLFTEVTEDCAYIQGIILKNENKEEEQDQRSEGPRSQLLIITPDYIEKKEEMVFCKKDNKNYVIGKRGGCWGLKLQNISKETLVVRLSKDKEEIANMLLRPGQKYFMNNYNIKGGNYFEIQESESTEKTVKETIQEGTFDIHKNEYELHVYPVERLDNYESYKYLLDDFIKRKEKKRLMTKNNYDYLNFCNKESFLDQTQTGNYQSQVKLGNTNREGKRQKSRQFGQIQYGNASIFGQENGVEKNVERQGCGEGNLLEDSKHTMHKMSERKKEERLSTADISEQLDQCMKLQFVVIIKKTLEVNVIEDKRKLVEMLDSQLQKKWTEQVSENNRYVQDECIVCYTEKPEKIFAKCGHGCTCQNCYEEFKKQAQRNCPLCRSVIQGVFSV